MSQLKLRPLRCRGAAYSQLGPVDEKRLAVIKEWGNQYLRHDEMMFEGILPALREIKMVSKMSEEELDCVLAELERRKERVGELIYVRNKQRHKI